MVDAKQIILLTGATGGLGHYVLARLVTASSATIRVLLRPPVADSRQRLADLLRDLLLDLPALIASERVQVVEGDLPDAVDASIVDHVETIIHAAGSTTFDTDASGDPGRTNVAGTQALLNVARGSSVRRFVLVSTAYVCGDRDGVIPERIERSPPTFRNDYERSKWQAEQLVWAEFEGDRHCAVCRPAILFGDCPAGRASSFTGVYLIARATGILARAVADDTNMNPHEVPLRILGHPDATSNLVPVDWAAERIVSVAVDPSAYGRVHHITNSRPPTHAEIKQWLEDYFDIAGGVFCDREGPLNDPNHFEELFYSCGDILRDYFRRGLSFQSRWADQHGEVSLVTREHFLKAIAYAHQRKWKRLDPASRSNNRPNDRVDPRWYFEEFLPQAIPRSSVANIHALTTTVQFVIGEQRHGWICRFERGRLLATRRAPRNGDAEFGYEMAEEAFSQIVSGRKSPQAVFLLGQAEMFGNYERALRMVSIISQFIKERPVNHG